MSLDDALTVVQFGILALVTVGLLVFVRQQMRRPRRGPTPAQMLTRHDEICSVAPWPHTGFCCPTGGDDIIGRMIMLAVLADQGIGRVDTMTGLAVDRDGGVTLIDWQEDETCNGQD